MLVCFVSATPSFLLAGMVAAHTLPGVSAMILGILTFVAIFVLLESRQGTRRLMLDQTLRRAVKTGYISRMILTVVFPAAVFVDIYCGIMSVGLVESVFGFAPMRDAANDFNVLSDFAWFYMTTLVQGVILNFVVSSFTLLVYAVLLVWKGFKGRSSLREE